MIELQDITRENWIACACLELAEQQRAMVASNVDSIAESKFEPHFRPRAIYDGENMVGFLMYCVETDPPDNTLFWLFRFMIDIKYQAKGYGTAALQLAIAEMKASGAHRIYTMHKPSNAVASRLYKKAGFVEVGMLDDGDIELELTIFEF